MKWIKASERLPEVGRSKFMRAKGRGMFIGVNSIVDNKIHESSSLNPLEYDYEFIEWLDESPPPVQSDSGVEFGEWQICPVCNGTGQSMNHRNMIPLTTDTCTRCNGEKTIERPSLKTKELREALDGNAVEFCDWVRKNNYSQGVRFGLWGVDTDSTDMKVYTTSELYQKFIATKALNNNQ